MKISIITVTKNNKEGLLRAIECVRNQTYNNVEHIVVDGGSTDGSVEAIKNEQLKIKNLFPPTTNLPTGQAGYQLLTISEPDEGIYDAINKGIKLATGDVIGLLHSDDLFADDMVLEKYAEVFKSRAEGKEQSVVDAVYSDLVYVKKKSQVISSKSKEYEVQTERQFTTNYSTIRYWKTQVKEFTTESQRLRALKHGWMPPHPTLFIRKAIFDKYGLYRTDLKIASDYEMILRLLYKHKITTHYLPLTTYLMSIGGASNKSLKNILQKSKEDYLAMKLNGINFPVITLLSKNLRKLPQFVARDLR
jgi:glycosyltransferase